MSKQNLKKKLIEPLKALLDLRFIIPALFLIMSLIGNGIQCGGGALKKHWLERTKNALDLALSKMKNLEARKDVAEYEAGKKTTKEAILIKDKEYKRLLERAKKSEAELQKVKEKVGKLSIKGVRDGLNKHTGAATNTKGLPLEPVCEPCNCKDKP